MSLWLEQMAFQAVASLDIMLSGIKMRLAAAPGAGSSRVKCGNRAVQLQVCSEIKICSISTVAPRGMRVRYTFSRRDGATGIRSQIVSWL